LNQHIRTVAWIGLGVLVGIMLFAMRPTVHALPEYVTRTGEPCATCHVNPAGGGPRTVRGSLWLAAGRPDQVPSLPGTQEPAGAAVTDDRALYEKFACAGCHGAVGEGGAGPALNQAEWPADEVTQVIRNGMGSMMAYPANRLSDAELTAIVRFVQAIGRGEVKAESAAQRVEEPVMGPAQSICRADEGTSSTTTSCGGN